MRMPAYRGVKKLLAVCLAALLLTFVAAGLALLGGVWPEASGDKVLKKGNITVDASHAEQGYIMVRGKEGSQKLKLRITKGGDTYTYDLNSRGEYEVFPLQLGSGRYTVTLYKNVKSNRYSKDGEVTVNAKLEREDAAFLCPSQYVNYTQDSAAVRMSMELCANLSTSEEKVRAVQEFMSKGFAYDYVRALTGSESYLGDVDGCLEKRMGLCQDFAAVAACMLRVQGIPTQLVIGYADDTYHAWNIVQINGEYRRLDITAELKGLSRDAEYTAERIY